MNKKVLLAIIAIVIAVSGLAIINSQSNTSVTTNTRVTTNTSPAKTEDLGACKFIDRAALKATLGSEAASLSEPEDTGVISLGDQDKGQTCIYPFKEGGTIENGFYLEVADYSPQSFSKVAGFTAVDGTPVSGIGDKAMFKSGDALTTHSKEFVITAIKGSNVYLFVINQPDAAVTYDDATAMTALTRIAQSVTLK